MNPIISRHSEKRAKERTGLKKRSLKRLAQRILDNGLRSSSFSGRFRRYLDGLYLRHGTGNNLRVYGEHIYVFQNITLITVLNVPTEFKKYL